MNRLIMMLLGILMGLTAVAQNGVYLEYDAISKTDKNRRFSLKINSLDGNTIEESDVSANLRLKKEPNISYMLTNGGYFAGPDKQLAEYKIKVLGKDTVRGYNCTKISLVAYESQKDFETTIWISNEVPDYEKYLGANVNCFDLTKLNEALKKENLAGIIIKISNWRENSYEYFLKKVALVELKPSMFELKGQQTGGQTREELKKEGKINKEQNKAMIEAEQAAKKFAEEMDKKRAEEDAKRKAQEKP